MIDITNTFELWCKKAVADIDLITELEAIKNDFDKINDAFLRKWNLAQVDFVAK